MALDKNLKINTSSNFNFVMNGKQIKSLDDLPGGLKMISKVFLGNNNSLGGSPAFGKMAETLLNNPEIKQAITNKSLHINPFTKVISYNGKQINSVNNIPEPFKALANQALKDENNNQIPDFIETNVQKTTPNNTLINQEPHKANVPLKTPYHSYKPLNVAGNPLNKLQAILLVITVLIVLFYIFANA